MMKKYSMFLVLLMIFSSFLATAADLEPGPWRFELRATYGTIPFVINFEKRDGQLQGTLNNGKETIKLTDISVSDEKIDIPLQTYEISLEMSPPRKGLMEGFLIRHNKSPILKTPVRAVHGVQERFPQKKEKPLIDLSGKWSITLKEKGEDKKTGGVLIFDQKGSELNASILTPTGDYRYMTGFVSGQDFKAVSFDGVYNYLVEGRVENGKLKANILSSYQTEIEGERNPSAKLPDAYKQTQVESLSFQFPDLQGNKVSLKDSRFKGKPVIVQIFGSWCPNCLDEMNYLIPWYEKNKARGIEIVALAFERSLGPSEAKRQLLKTKKTKNVPYPILIAGTTVQDKPAEKLPEIKNFISFPTTIFLNKNHEVVKVHAGFSGPSTGEFYETWKKEFNQTVDEILRH